LWGRPGQQKGREGIVATTRGKGGRQVLDKGSGIYAEGSEEPPWKKKGKVRNPFWLRRKILRPSGKFFMEDEKKQPRKKGGKGVTPLRYRRKGSFPRRIGGRSYSRGHRNTVRGKMGRKEAPLLSYQGKKEKGKPVLLWGRFFRWGKKSCRRGIRKNGESYRLTAKRGGPIRGKKRKKFLM